MMCKRYPMIQNNSSSNVLSYLYYIVCDIFYFIFRIHPERQQFQLVYLVKCVMNLEGFRARLPSWPCESCCYENLWVLKTVLEKILIKIKKRYSSLQIIFKTFIRNCS